MNDDGGITMDDLFKDSHIVERNQEYISYHRSNLCPHHAYFIDPQYRAQCSSIPLKRPLFVPSTPLTRSTSYGTQHSRDLDFSFLRSSAQDPYEPLIVVPPTSPVDIVRINNQIVWYERHVTQKHRYEVKTSSKSLVHPSPNNNLGSTTTIPPRTAPKQSLAADGTPNISMSYMKLPYSTLGGAVIDPHITFQFDAVGPSSSNQLQQSLMSALPSSLSNLTALSPSSSSTNSFYHPLEASTSVPLSINYQSSTYCLCRQSTCPFCYKWDKSGAKSVAEHLLSITSSSQVSSGLYDTMSNTSSGPLAQCYLCSIDIARQVSPLHYASVIKNKQLENEALYQHRMHVASQNIQHLENRLYGQGLYLQSSPSSPSSSSDYDVSTKHIINMASHIYQSSQSISPSETVYSEVIDHIVSPRSANRRVARHQSFSRYLKKAWKIPIPSYINSTNIFSYIDVLSSPLYTGRGPNNRKDDTQLFNLMQNIFEQAIAKPSIYLLIINQCIRRPNFLRSLAIDNTTYNKIILPYLKDIMTYIQAKNHYNIIVSRYSPLLDHFSQSYVHNLRHKIESNNNYWDQYAITMSKSPLSLRLSSFHVSPPSGTPTTISPDSQNTPSLGHTPNTPSLDATPTTPTDDDDPWLVYDYISNFGSIQSSYNDISSQCDGLSVHLPRGVHYMSSIPLSPISNDTNMTDKYISDLSAPTTKCIPAKIALDNALLPFPVLSPTKLLTSCIDKHIIIPFVSPRNDLPLSLNYEAALKSTQLTSGSTSCPRIRWDQIPQYLTSASNENSVNGIVSDQPSSSSPSSPSSLLPILHQVNPLISLSHLSLPKRSLDPTSPKVLHLPSLSSLLLTMASSPAVNNTVVPQYIKFASDTIPTLPSPSNESKISNSDTTMSQNPLPIATLRSALYPLTLPPHYIMPVLCSYNKYKVITDHYTIYKKHTMSRIQSLIKYISTSYLFSSSSISKNDHHKHVLTSSIDSMVNYTFHLPYNTHVSSIWSPLIQHIKNIRLNQISRTLYPFLPYDIPFMSSNNDNIDKFFAYYISSLVPSYDPVSSISRSNATERHVLHTQQLESSLLQNNIDTNVLQDRNNGTNHPTRKLLASHLVTSLPDTLFPSHIFPFLYINLIRTFSTPFKQTHLDTFETRLISRHGFPVLSSPPLVPFDGLPFPSSPPPPPHIRAQMYDLFFIVCLLKNKIAKNELALANQSQTTTITTNTLHGKPVGSGSYSTSGITRSSDPPSTNIRLNTASSPLPTDDTPQKLFRPKPSSTDTGIVLIDRIASVAPQKVSERAVAPLKMDSTIPMKRPLPPPSRAHLDDDRPSMMICDGMSDSATKRPKIVSNRSDSSLSLSRPPRSTPPQTITQIVPGTVATYQVVKQPASKPVPSTNASSSYITSTHKLSMHENDLHAIELYRHAEREIALQDYNLNIDEYISAKSQIYWMDIHFSHTEQYRLKYHKYEQLLRQAKYGTDIEIKKALKQLNLDHNNTIRIPNITKLILQDYKLNNHAITPGLESNNILTQERIYIEAKNIILKETKMDTSERRRKMEILIMVNDIVGKAIQLVKNRQMIDKPGRHHAQQSVSTPLNSKNSSNGNSSGTKMNRIVSTTNTTTRSLIPSNASRNIQKSARNIQPAMTPKSPPTSITKNRKLTTLKSPVAVPTRGKKLRIPLKCPPTDHSSSSSSTMSSLSSSSSSSSSSDSD